jgi:DNA invertase Pin-like site-specific DNA recombinase
VANQSVGIYTRVSTDLQSVDMQLAALRAHCTNRGWSIFHEYRDEGISGRTSSRPGLDQLMSDARKRKLDCVLVWAFDRFARSTKHLLIALEEFKSLGIQFVSYQQNIDTAGPFGEFFFTIVAAFGQLEHAMIRERVKAGLRNARAKGKRLGRPRVFVSEQRVEMLRGLGLSWRDIAKQLGVGVGTVHRIAQRRSKNVCGSFGTDGLTEPEETGLLCALAEPLTAGG